MAIISYTKCSKCQKVANVETTTIRGKLNDIEGRQRIDTKRMISDILGKQNYSIKFPATSLPEIHCPHCGYRNKKWGWTSQRRGKFTIFIPRQTFLLPRDEFVDTAVAHEPAHVQIGWEDEAPNPRHGPRWYKQYRKNKKKAFNNYDKFINSSQTLPVKYHKEYGKIYPSIYEAEYDEEDEE